MSQIFPTFKVNHETLIQDATTLLEKIDKQIEIMITVQNPSWSDYEKDEELSAELEQLMFNVNHLTSVKDLPKLEDEYEKLIPILNKYSSKWSQDQRSYEFYQKLSQTDLNETQKYIVKNYIDGFKTSGLTLSPDDKVVFNTLNTDLSVLSHNFSKNCQTSSDEFKLLITNIEELKGIPEEDISRFKHNALADNKEGYLITLQMPDYLAIMTYADNSDLRKKLYLAFGTIATKGESDNSQNIVNLLSKRKDKAKLLGFDTFADYSVFKKMAQSPQEVFDLINTLKDKALNQSIKETELINAFGKSLGFNKVELWDTSYLCEKLVLRDYQFDEVDFKKYLPVNNCLKGLFWFLKEMFNVDIKYIDTPHTYDENLQLLELSKNGEIISYIYMDLYSRKGKKSGAWMNNVVDKSSTQLPIAVVVCNFAAPTDKTPSLLTFDHLETLFHEFGHATHHALSTVPYPYATGVNNVPWDAIEVPSTLMEFFCINDSVLNQITEHYETGETLPSNLKENLVKSKNFLFSKSLMRQLEFTITDMKLHMEDITDVHAYLNELRESLSIPKLPEDCKPLNNFRHIFSGGYAAGYYSYKWSDILSADIFKTFSDNGVLCKDTAKKYLDEYLSQGGSKDPNELFFNFKGRTPTPDAFLELNGI